MAGERSLNFSLVLRAFDRGVLGTLTRVQQGIKNIDEAAKHTEKLREYSGRLAMAGAAMIGAGAAGALALRSLVDPAIAMQGEMAHVATAMSDGAEQQSHLNQVRQFSLALAQKSVLSETEVAQAYYIARSNMLGHAQALKAVAAANNVVIATTTNAAAAQAAMEPTTRTLTTLVQNFGGTIQHYADMMTTLQTHYAFRDIGELNEALQYAMPVAKNAGIARRQMFAALALLSQGGLHGAEAGTAFEELIQKLGSDRKLAAFVRMNKLGGMDLVATMEALHNAFSRLPKVIAQRELAQIGIGMRSALGVGLLSDKMTAFNRIGSDLQRVGVASREAKIRLKAFDEQWASFESSFEVLRTDLGALLLPDVTRLLTGLQHAVHSLIQFTQHHQALARYAMLFAAIGSAVLIFGGAIAVALGGLGLFVASVSALGIGLGVAVGLLAAIPAAIAAIAAAGYEIYQHWSAVERVLIEIGHAIEHIAEMMPGVRTAMGIFHGIEHLFGGGGTTATVSHVHSTVARARAATVGAAALGALAMGAAPAIAAARPASAVVIDHHPTVHVTINGNADAAQVHKAVKDALQEHADEIHDAVARVAHVRNRREF